MPKSIYMPDNETEEAFGKKPGHWISLPGGKRFFIEEGKEFEQALSESQGHSKEKASYMTASQEPAVKQPSHNPNTPHYVLTADEINTNMTNARVGERVKYNHGTKEGTLIKIDRSVALILNGNNTYDTVLTKDVNRSDDYTTFGLWKDIPENFRAWMLKKCNAPSDYINKDWNHIPPVLKRVLKDDSVFEQTGKTENTKDPSNTDDFDGAKNKHADAKNPNHRDAPGTSGNTINPQDNKRRDGRQFPDNEEQNNTFSAGEEHPEEPYSVNITGGSNVKEDYGTQLNDWRFGEPKPFKDQKQTLQTKKVDQGTNSYQGENKPLSENPSEVVDEEDKKKYHVGVPSVGKTNGVKYMTADEVKKFQLSKKRDV